jgi:hypothetical protein
MKLIKKNYKKSLKRPKLNPDNFQNLWLYSWDRNYLIEVTQKKKKPWSKILNHLNIEGWNWKKNSINKGIKKQIKWQSKKQLPNLV